MARASVASVILVALGVVAACGGPPGADAGHVFAISLHDSIGLECAGPTKDPVSGLVQWSCLDAAAFPGLDVTFEADGAGVRHVFARSPIGWAANDDDAFAAVLQAVPGLADFDTSTVRDQRPGAHLDVGPARIELGRDTAYTWMAVELTHRSRTTD